MRLVLFHSVISVTSRLGMCPTFGSDTYTLSRLAAAGMHLELRGHAEVPRSGQARRKTVSLMWLGAAAFAPLPTVPDKSGELGADSRTWCTAKFR